MDSRNAGDSVRSSFWSRERSEGVGWGLDIVALTAADLMESWRQQPLVFWAFLLPGGLWLLLFFLAPLS